MSSYRELLSQTCYVRSCIWRACTYNVHLVEIDLATVMEILEVEIGELTVPVNN